MFKCDKCGCEHSQRTVCPKCGAPVVIVNEDYLLRRQQWEQQQKEHLRYKKQGGGSESLTRASKQGSGRKKTSLHRERPKFSKSGKASGIRAFMTADAEEKKKGNKEKNANELNGSRKVRRKGRRLKINRRMIIAAVTVLSAVVVAVAAVFVGISIYRSIDRSDVRYFDGRELVSVKEGVLFNIDSEEDCTLVAYTEGLNALMLKSGDELVGWYEGKEYILVSDMGALTEEYLFSESGRYLAYVMYSEPDKRYSLVIYDLKDGSSNVYGSAGRINLVAVTPDGEVLYEELETTGYSIVVSMSIYTANTARRLLAAESVTDVCYDVLNNSMLFIKDESLYVCSLSDECLDKYEGIISDREHVLVNEDVIAIADNRLGKDVLYITDDGLWTYKEGVSRLAAPDVDSSAVIYYDGAKSLYYRISDKLYFAEQDNKSVQSMDSKQEYLEAGGVTYSGSTEMVLEGLSGDIVVSQDGDIWCLDSSGNLYCSDKGAASKKNGKIARLKHMESGVIFCGTLYGEAGCVFLKEDELICCYGDSGKKRLLLEKDIKKEFFPGVVLCSGAHAYYVSSDSELWKIAKKSGLKESMGIVKLLGIYN